MRLVITYEISKKKMSARWYLDAVFDFIADGLFEAVAFAHELRDLLDERLEAQLPGAALVGQRRLPLAALLVQSQRRLPALLQLLLLHQLVQLAAPRRFFRLHLSRNIFV